MKLINVYIAKKDLDNHRANPQGSYLTPSEMYMIERGYAVIRELADVYVVKYQLTNCNHSYEKRMF